GTLFAEQGDVGRPDPAAAPRFAPGQAHPLDGGHGPVSTRRVARPNAARARAVELRAHQGARLLGVAQAEGVAQLVGDDENEVLRVVELMDPDLALQADHLAVP